MLNLQSQRQSGKRFQAALWRMIVHLQVHEFQLLIFQPKLTLSRMSRSRKVRGGDHVATALKGTPVAMVNACVNVVRRGWSASSGIKTHRLGARILAGQWKYLRSLRLRIEQQTFCRRDIHRNRSCRRAVFPFFEGKRSRPADFTLKGLFSLPCCRGPNPQVSSSPHRFEIRIASRRSGTRPRRPRVRAGGAAACCQ